MINIYPDFAFINNEYVEDKLETRYLQVQAVAFNSNEDENLGDDIVEITLRQCSAKLDNGKPYLADSPIYTLGLTLGDAKGFVNLLQGAINKIENGICDVVMELDDSHAEDDDEEECSNIPKNLFDDEYSE